MTLLILIFVRFHRLLKSGSTWKESLLHSSRLMVMNRKVFKALGLRRAQNLQSNQMWKDVSKKWKNLFLNNLLPVNLKWKIFLLENHRKSFLLWNLMRWNWLKFFLIERWRDYLISFSRKGITPESNWVNGLGSERK